MKILIDFFPIIVFYLVFKVFTDEDIYTATAATIVASFIQISIMWIRTRKFEKMHLITLGIVVVMGGLTIALHDDTFIKWKPSIVNFVFAGAFLGSHFIGQRTLVERLMTSQIDAAAGIWTRLNILWILFFLASGLINIYVAFYYGLDLPEKERTAIWVNFKLFGMLGLTFVFIIGQGLWLARHAEQRPLDDTTADAAENTDARKIKD